MQKDSLYPGTARKLLLTESKHLTQAKQQTWKRAIFSDDKHSRKHLGFIGNLQHCPKQGTGTIMMSQVDRRIDGPNYEILKEILLGAPKVLD